MNFRKVKIFSGKSFRVPEHIQRLDSDATHGWQLRYGRGTTETELFSDHSNDGSGAAAALERAVSALRRRIKQLPAPTGLRTAPLASKSSDLPVGVSGPVERHRTGRNTPSYSFLVSVPLATGGSTTRSVYIGTANTMTRKREKEARAKAVAIREEAARKFAVAKTRAKRRTAAVALAPR